MLNRLAMKDSVPGTDLQAPGVTLPEDLFDPADVDRYRRVLDRLAVPYKVDSRGRASALTCRAIPMTAADGLVSTVRDLARLDAELDSNVLLLAGTRALAWSPAPGRDGVPSPMGLGWFVQNYRGERVVWHFGLRAECVLVARREAASPAHHVHPPREQ